MSIRYRIDVIKALKAAGFSTYRIRKEKLLHEMALQALRDGKMVSWEIIDKICALLECQPGDIVEWVKDDNASEAQI